MDPVYNVGVSNRFALFQDEEDDPGDVILAASTRPEKSDKDGKKAKAVKGKGKETSQKAQQLAGKKAVVETPNSEYLPILLCVAPQTTPMSMLSAKAIAAAVH